MIIEFQPNKILPTSPPCWRVYYTPFRFENAQIMGVSSAESNVTMCIKNAQRCKQENEFEFNEIILNYETLKLFLEKYGLETNDILTLHNFGLNVGNIKHNKNLK
jgi:hypothetical protein